MSTNDTRRRIHAHVRDHPGVHFSELVRRLDLAPGQVQYHLRRLGGEVTREEVSGRTHYFTDGYDEWERRALAMARRETARDVLAVLLARGPSAPGDVADEVGIARSTLEWHLDTLVESDLVRKDRDDSGRVTLVLSRPEETAALLGEVSPSFPGRMVDRFGRLVDDLL